MVLLDHILSDKIFVKITLGIQIAKKFTSEDVFEQDMNHLHPLKFCQKECGQVEPFLS